jgi:hypothetical protein
MHLNILKLLPEGFESLSDCRERQRQMVERLIRHGISDAIRDLANCRSKVCAIGSCTEACHFATRSRRIDNIATGVRLLESHGGPYFDLCIVHPLWEAPIGDLSDIKIRAALQWTYRRLKRLEGNALALGIFEVSLNRELDGESYWAGEVRMTIAGISKPDIRKALQIETKYHDIRPRQRIVQIGEIEDLEYQFSYSTKRFIEQRVAYIDPATLRQNRRHLPPPSALWAEHDAWLHSLRIGARTLAFGCGRRGGKFHIR